MFLHVSQPGFVFLCPFLDTKPLFFQKDQHHLVFLVVPLSPRGCGASSVFKHHLIVGWLTCCCIASHALWAEELQSSSDIQRTLSWSRSTENSGFQYKQWERKCQKEDIANRRQEEASELEEQMTVRRGRSRSSVPTTAEEQHGDPEKGMQDDRSPA